MVGGSVTGGKGADNPAESYRERLFTWINTTFPHPDHAFHNGALNAASSVYMQQCIQDFVPEGMDLVLVRKPVCDRPALLLCGMRPGFGSTKNTQWRPCMQIRPF